MGSAGGSGRVRDLRPCPHRRRPYPPAVSEGRLAGDGAADEESVMNVSDVGVLLVAVGLAVGLGWYFFAPRRGRVAELGDGVQRVEVTVRGGYSPDIIRVRQGIPVEMVFDRQESGDCTSRVVFGDLAVSAALPAFTRTAVRLNPQRAGSFGFACGMNMVHGTLVVEPSEQPAPGARTPVAASLAAQQRADGGAEVSAADV